MGWFSKNKNDSSTFVNGRSSEPVSSPAKNVQMKEYAINLCASYIARFFSMSSFLTKDERWSYRLNVKPNVNQSASEFWREVIFRLYKEGDALIVMTTDNQLYSANEFEPSDFDVNEMTFSGVTIGDYTFQRDLKADEVFYFVMKNQDLKLFTESIYKDYEEIIGQMFTASKLSNQLRFKANYKQPNLDEESKAVAKKVSADWVKVIENSSIVSLPVNPSLEYEEVNKPDKQALSIAPIDEATWSFVDKVAVILGIPSVLLHGDVAGVKEAKQLFFSNCLEPLNSLVEDEINAKIFTENEYNEDVAVKIMGANRPNVFEMADKADKLISSGAFNRNEIRALLGYDAVDGLDDYVITLNYQSINQQNQQDSNLKGGENENE